MRICRGNSEGICITIDTKLGFGSFACRLLIGCGNNKVPHSSQSRFFDPTKFLANAGIGRTIQQYAQNQTIFSQGKLADAVYYIQEGRVRLSVVSRQGKEATIALLGPGDFLGEGCIASDQPVRMATATALHCVRS